MEDKLTDIKLALTAVVGILSGFWGWLGWLVVTWVCCMVLDYITGSAAAGLSGAWQSSKAREGIFHKGGMLVVVLVAAATDLLLALVLDNLPVVTLPVEYSGLVCPVVLVWYIVTELGSICENAVAMGAPVPKLLLRLLATAGDAVEQVGERLDERLDTPAPEDNTKEEKP